MIEEKLKDILNTESDDASWEITTNSEVEGKDLRLMYFKDVNVSNSAKTMDLTYRELNDLINFLDKLQGRI